MKKNKFIGISSFSFENLPTLSINDVVINLREVRKAIMDKTWVMEPIVRQIEKMPEKIKSHIT